MKPWTYTPPVAPLVVLHHDRDLLAIDKPSGLLSVPGRAPETTDSALSRVLSLVDRAYPVHRLDMDTSGVLAFALRRKAERAVMAQFADRSVRKQYRARVLGSVTLDEQIIDAPLTRQQTSPPTSLVDPGGKPARTDVRVLARDGDSTLLQLHPRTGRSHQLRVHLAHIAHPILGDRFYGTIASREAAPRLLLHARSLTLRHPWSNEVLTITAPIADPHLSLG